MDICLRVLKESKKSRFDSCSVRNSILIISHITFRDCRVHIFPTALLEIAVYTSTLRVLVYTAISREVVGKNVHATISKGNMGYD